MATPEISRRTRQQMRRQASAEQAETISRADMRRMAQEQRMERQFAWTFLVTISATTAYLIWRMPWGQEIIRRFH